MADCAPLHPVTHNFAQFSDESGRGSGDKKMGRQGGGELVSYSPCLLVCVCAVSLLFILRCRTLAVISAVADGIYQCGLAFLHLLDGAFEGAVEIVTILEGPFGIPAH